jgi:CSLREA domain-containing protein
MHLKSSGLLLRPSLLLVVLLAVSLLPQDSVKRVSASPAPAHRMSVLVGGAGPVVWSGRAKPRAPWTPWTVAVWEGLERFGFRLTTAALPKLTATTTFTGGTCPSTLTVNDLGDGADATPGNGVCATSGGVCTLRAALQEANAQTACTPLTINFGVTGTINLTGALPDLNHPNLTINGPGAAQLTVRRSTGGDYRIFTVNEGTAVTLNGLTITNGFVTEQGGGLSNVGGTLTINDCIISGNTAFTGGGLLNDSGTLMINHSAIVNNFITGRQGGGIFSFGGTLILNGCTISGNQSAPAGLELQGGGMDLQSTSATLTNCTISNNPLGSAVTNIAGFANTTVVLTNCTVTGNNTPNSAAVSTVGTAGFSGTTQLKNTLVAANGARPNFRVGGAAVLASLGNNLDSDGSSGFTNGVNGDLVGTSSNKLNALLAALGSYGGALQTHALLPGSPAINAGTSSGAPTNDQRGSARAGAVDIGAFESQGFTLAINSGNNQSAPINTAFANPLAALVTALGAGEAVNGGLVTFTSPVSGASATIAGNPATIASGTATTGTVTANDIIGGPYTVAASAHGVPTGVNFSLTNINSPPSITPANLTRQQGNQPINTQIATVADVEDAEETLTVTIAGGNSATSNGVTINNLTVNAAGQVRADLAVTCTATNASFTLAVTDSSNATATTTLNVTVPANTAPALGNYPNSTVVTGGTLAITPDVLPTDNNTVVSVTATAVPNSFTGTFSGNTSSGGVTVTIANPAGSYTITVTLTDNCGATTTRSFMLTVSACGAVLSKQRELLAANGGNNSFIVTIDNVCSWTATSDNPDWITVTAPMGGFAGAGTVSYSIASNTTSTRRTGSITVAGQTFRVWQGGQYGDVPPTHAFYDFIGKLSALGITLGCGNGNYCPDANTTREQMAIFIERAIGVTNPPVPTQQTFQDVPPTLIGYPFIEDFVARGITQGCAAGPPRLFCPTGSVTREQVAIFILRGLGVFTPPAGPQTPTFGDVPNSGATDYSYEFIEEFARRGITSGCAAGPPRLYCPAALVTRGQMAVFLVRAFGT